MGTELGNIARQVAAGLSAASIDHRMGEDGYLIVPLPNDFGELEIGTLDGPNGDDLIIGLVGHAWHTHGTFLCWRFSCGTVEAIVQYVEGMFQGRYLLIEELVEGREPTKYIGTYLDDPDDDGDDPYLKNPPPGTQYKVYNR
jgi:hypothetical protein